MNEEFKKGGMIPDHREWIPVYIPRNECILDRTGKCRRRSLLHKLTYSHRAIKEIAAYRRWLARQRKKESR
jgi:hypothetical protein